MSSQKDKEKIIRYRLKTMVIARICAEFTVLVILILLPIVLFSVGILESMAAAYKVILIALAIIAALLVPVYGFITFLVEVRDRGLTARALFRQQSCAWHEVKKISRRSNWNWLRYVVELQDGELTFPVWLKDCDKLVTTIRTRLPGGGGATSIFRKFSQDPISLIFQAFQAIFGLGVVVVFWFFYVEMTHEQSMQSFDSMLILFFCLALTILAAWRSGKIALMPRSIELTARDLVVKTIFYEKEIPWTEVRSVKASLPLLPEGFTISTKEGSYLIGNGMDSLDELVGAISSRCSKEIEKKTGR